MAFRKRMKKRGYTDISIVRVKDKPLFYLVTAIDPACRVLVSSEVDYRSMPYRCK